jgi:hypothetical protein
MRVPKLGAVVAALLIVPGLCAAQSLGEVAAREKARRDKQKTAQPPAKVMTEEDLRKARSSQVSEFVTTSTSGGTTGTPAPEGTEGKPVPGAGGTASPAPGSSPAPAASPSAEQREAAQTDWRNRLGIAQQDVTKGQAEVARLEGLLADNMSQPYGTGRVAVQARLDETRRLLAVAQGRVTELQDEGRRNGFR